MGDTLRGESITPSLKKDLNDNLSFSKRIFKNFYSNAKLTTKLPFAF